MARYGDRDGGREGRKVEVHGHHGLKFFPKLPPPIQRLEKRGYPSRIKEHVEAVQHCVDGEKELRGGGAFDPRGQAVISQPKGTLNAHGGEQYGKNDLRTGKIRCRGWEEGR